MQIGTMQQNKPTAVFFLYANLKDMLWKQHITQNFKIDQFMTPTNASPIVFSLKGHLSLTFSALLTLCEN